MARTTTRQPKKLSGDKAKPKVYKGYDGNKRTHKWESTSRHPVVQQDADKQDEENLKAELRAFLGGQAYRLYREFLDTLWQSNDLHRRDETIELIRQVLHDDPRLVQFHNLLTEIYNVEHDIPLPTLGLTDAATSVQVPSLAATVQAASTSGQVQVDHDRDGNTASHDDAAQENSHSSSSSSLLSEIVVAPYNGYKADNVVEEDSQSSPASSTLSEIVVAPYNSLSASGGMSHAVVEKNQDSDSTFISIRGYEKLEAEGRSEEEEEEEKEAEEDYPLELDRPVYQLNDVNAVDASNNIIVHAGEFVDLTGEDDESSESIDGDSGDDSAGGDNRPEIRTPGFIFPDDVHSEVQSQSSPALDPKTANAVDDTQTLTTAMHPPVASFEGTDMLAQQTFPQQAPFQTVNPIDLEITQPGMEPPIMHDEGSNGFYLDGAPQHAKEFPIGAADLQTPDQLLNAMLSRVAEESQAEFLNAVRLNYSDVASREEMLDHVFPVLMAAFHNDLVLSYLYGQFTTAMNVENEDRQAQGLPALWKGRFQTLEEALQSIK